jgi:hypothetical protein
MVRHPTSPIRSSRVAAITFISLIPQLVFSASGVGQIKLSLSQPSISRCNQAGRVLARTGLTPDDSPLFLRDNSAREIYALDVDFPLSTTHRPGEIDHRFAVHADCA